MQLRATTLTAKHYDQTESKINYYCQRNWVVISAQFVQKLLTYRTSYDRRFSRYIPVDCWTSSLACRQWIIIYAIDRYDSYCIRTNGKSLLYETINSLVLS